MKKTGTTFDDLFKLFYPKVKKFALRFVGDEMEADEIAQKVFIKLWKRRDSLDEILDFDRFIFAVARNATLDLLRSRTSFSRRNDAAASSAAEDLSTNDVEAASDLSDIKAQLSTVLERMPDKRRRIFLMSREECRSNEEIASEMNISKRTVEKHLQLAVSDIRRKIKMT